MNKRTLKYCLAGGLLLGVLCLLLFGLSFTARSLKAAAHIRSLRFESLGFGQVLFEYQLDLDTGLAEYNSYEYDGTLRTHKEGRLSDAQQKQLQRACGLALVPLWKDQYVDPRICDGDQWRMVIGYEDEEKGIFGSNAYPPFYWWLRRRISEIPTWEQ